MFLSILLLRAGDTKKGLTKLPAFNFLVQNKSMRKIFVTVLFLSTINGLAQSQGKPDAFAKTITPADLKKHLFVVASAEMEGRETATPGQKKAAAYIESQFRALGLQPANGEGYQ